MKTITAFLCVVFIVSFGCTNWNANKKQLSKEPTPEKLEEVNGHDPPHSEAEAEALVDSLAKKRKQMEYDEFVPEDWTKNRTLLNNLKYIKHREFPKDRYSWRPPSGLQEDTLFYMNYDTVAGWLYEPIKSNRIVFPVNSKLPVITSMEGLPPLSGPTKNWLATLIPTRNRSGSLYDKYTFAIYGRVFIYDDVESYIIVVKSPPLVDECDNNVGQSISSYLLNVKNGRQLLSMLRLSFYMDTDSNDSDGGYFHLPNGIIINKSGSRGNGLGNVPQWIKDGLIKHGVVFNEVVFSVYKVDKTGFIKMLGPDDVKVSN